MPHDLTDIQTTPFEYTLKVNGQPFMQRLDLDGIALDLQRYLGPSAFEPTGEMSAKGPILGLQISFETLVGQRREEDLPRNLPSPEMVKIAVAKAFRVPEPHDKNPRVLFALFLAWNEEQKRRTELKKDMPDSPDSPVPSPAVSNSAT